MNNKEIIYWKQRNGELISIDNMDINHLRNVLKLIIKNKNRLKTALNEKLEKEKHIKAANLSDEDDDRFKFESDLGVRFNDDEARGNQW
jgi:hypothetical protein